MIARLFDYSSDKGSPWVNCQPGQCSYGNRITASIISKRAPGVYDLWDSYNGGVLLSPSHTTIKCSYSRDGFTYNIYPDGCPADDCVDNNCGVYYCNGVGDEFWWKCGWRANQLSQMLSMHEARRSQGADHTDYNEIVVDVDNYLHALPHSIEAFFYTAWADEGQKQYVIGAHSSFKHSFRHAAAVPLLKYDPGGSNSAPFVRVS